MNKPRTINFKVGDEVSYAMPSGILYGEIVRVIGAGETGAVEIQFEDGRKETKPVKDRALNLLKRASGSSEAEERLVELQMALRSLVAHGDELQGVDRADILRRAVAGEVVVLDVRPTEEFEAAHLPHARSMPVSELKQRLAELPKDLPVVAYCRGPFCLMAKDAVEQLRKKGYQAFHLTDGLAEWRARGLPVSE